MDQTSKPKNARKQAAEKQDEVKSNQRARAAEVPYEPEYEEAHRKPAADRENAFNSLAWMLEGATGLLVELRRSDLGLSEEFWVHAHAARRESLLAVRAVLDEMIERSGAEGQRQSERSKRRERRGDINIEF